MQRNQIRQNPKSQKHQLNQEFVHDTEEILAQKKQRQHTASLWNYCIEFLWYTVQVTAEQRNASRENSEHFKMKNRNTSKGQLIATERNNSFSQVPLADWKLT